VERIEKNNLIYYQKPEWDVVKHGVFTRHGGVSPDPWQGLNLGGTVGDEVANVHENHALVYETLDVPRENACTTWQVHKADVVIAQTPVKGRRWIAQADAIITDVPDIPLVQRYADCVPLLYHDPHKKAIGIAHAGWRGTVQGVASHVVTAMQQAYGSNPADIEVVIGPSISPERFQVGEEVVEAVEDFLGTLDGLMQRDPADNTAYVNLWEANKMALERAGVEKITVMGICTVDNTHDFYSHRGEKGRAGRFGVVMAL